MDVMIRFARDCDLEVMAEISAISKKRAYDGIVTAEILDRPIQDKNYRDAQMAVRMKKRTSIVALDKATGQVVGFAQFVLGNEETNAEYADAELCSLYVYPDCQGKGVGVKLLQRVKELCSVDGNKRLALFCFQDNANAVKFYTKNGGTILKEQMHQFGDKEYPHWVFIFKLAHFS